MIGGRRAHPLEERAPVFERRDVAAVRIDRTSRQLAQPRDLLAPRRVQDVDRQIRPERRPDRRAPARIANLLMPRQRIGRRVRRAQHFDVEPLEQRARPERRLRQLPFEMIVDGLRGRAVQRLGHAEHVFELVLQPGAARRAAEQMEVIGEELPDRARVLLDRRPVERRHAEPFQRDALRVEHARHVMIGNHQQRGRIGKRRVFRQHPRIDVSVRADQRK